MTSMPFFDYTTGFKEFFYLQKDIKSISYIKKINVRYNLFNFKNLFRVGAVTPTAFAM